MIHRALLDLLIARLNQSPAVALHGARQTGKTTLATQVGRQLDAVYFDLEDPQHYDLFADPVSLINQHRHRLVIIDEAQRRPELFPLLRVAIDRDRRPGRFLLLGSASPDLSRQRAESLAGRVSIVDLPPLTLQEVTAAGITRDALWLRGGFPKSLLAETDESSMQWRRDYLRDFFDRDLRLLGFDLAPERARRCFLMLTHVHGQLWNASQLSRSLDVSAHTANRYLDALCQTYLVRRLVPHFANIGKRLRKAPKVYLADTGLLHALLGIPNKDALLHHPAAGFSWEGFVVEQVAALLPFGWELSFWRTSGGSEIDILLLNAAQPAIAIEAKLGETNPRPRRGFHQACADLQIPNRWLVYPGHQSYELDGNYHLLPLSEMLERLRGIVGSAPS